MRHIFFGFSALAAISYLAYAFGGSESSSATYTRTERAPLPVASRVFEHTRSGDLGEQHIIVEKVAKNPKIRFAGAGTRDEKEFHRANPSEKGFSRASYNDALESDGNQAAQLAALGIKPREGQPPRQMVKEKGFSRRLSKGRILAKRWDKKVSGPNAHPAVFGRKSEGGCSASNIKLCDLRTVRDATFTGVVVDTERLTEEPSHPLDGQVKAGHYVEATPAVYVK